MPKLDARKLLDLKESLKASKQAKPLIVVHMGTCGIASGAEEVLTYLLELVRESGDDIIIKTSGCAGLCSREPMITVKMPEKPPVKYCQIDRSKAKRIYAEHVKGGKPVREYAIGYGCEMLY